MDCKLDTPILIFVHAQYRSLPRVLAVGQEYVPARSLLSSAAYEASPFCV